MIPTRRGPMEIGVLPVAIRDGSPDEVIAHAAVLMNLADLPVDADLEDGFADDLDPTAETRWPAILDR